MGRFGTVLQKEWLDARRDRRSLFSALTFAFFGPLMVASLVFFMANQVEESQTPDTRIAIVGAQYAPSLMKALRDTGFEIIEKDEAGPDTIQSGEAETVLLISEKFSENYMNGQPAYITMYEDQSKRFASRAVNAQLSLYESRIREIRMLARGVAPSEVDPLRIRRHDVSIGGAVASSLADMIMYFFMFAPFFASMGVAVDMTAGERERESLQPLLVQPISPRTIIMGKWMVAALFGVVGSIITVVVGAFVLDWAPIEKLGTNLTFTPLNQFIMVLVLIPLALMVSAVQIAVALLARNFKEAQTYISMLSFVPVVLGVYTIYSDSGAGGIANYLPILLQIDQLNTLAFGEALDPMGVAISLATTFIVTFLALAFSAHMLGRERMLQVS